MKLTYRIIAILICLISSSIKAQVSKNDRGVGILKQDKSVILISKFEGKMSSQKYYKKLDKLSLTALGGFTNDENVYTGYYGQLNSKLVISKLVPFQNKEIRSGTIVDNTFTNKIGFDINYFMEGSYLNLLVYTSELDQYYTDSNYSNDELILSLDFNLDDIPEIKLYVEVEYNDKNDTEYFELYMKELRYENSSDYCSHQNLDGLHHFKLNLDEVKNVVDISNEVNINCAFDVIYKGKSSWGKYAMNPFNEKILYVGGNDAWQKFKKDGALNSWWGQYSSLLASQGIIVDLPIDLTEENKQKENTKESYLDRALWNTLFQHKKDSISNLISNGKDLKKLTKELYNLRFRRNKILQCAEDSSHPYVEQFSKNNNLYNLHYNTSYGVISITDELGFDEMLKSLIKVLNDEHFANAFLYEWFNFKYNRKEIQYGYYELHEETSISEKYIDKSSSRLQNNIGLMNRGLGFAFHFKYYNFKFLKNGEGGKGEAKASAGFYKTRFDYKTKLFTAESKVTEEQVKFLSDVLEKHFFYHPRVYSDQQFVYGKENKLTSLKISSNHNEVTLNQQFEEALKTLGLDSESLRKAKEEMAAMPNCGCNIKSIKDEGWVSDNGYETVTFENGFAKDIDFINGKWGIKGWIFNDYFDSREKLMQEVTRRCKDFACKN